MESLKKTIRVVAAIIEIDGKYLACRRAPHKASGGLWEFPGGKVEVGETAEEALVREILEELRIEIAVHSLFDISTTETEQGFIQLECFASSAIEMPTASSDHDQLMLLDLANLITLQWAKPDLPAVAKLVDSKRP